MSPSRTSPTPPALADRVELVLERFPGLARRKMSGYPTAVADDAVLAGWIEWAVAHAESLPPKRSPRRKLEGRPSAG